MTGRSSTRYSLAVLALQALWIAQPALAQVPLPSDLISPEVPHDVPTGSGASIQDLAIFAWREFIALNWTALDPATTGTRGRSNVNADFLTIKADSASNYPLLVWQTYRHKNELFPAGGQTDPSFDSRAPSYKYTGPPITAANNATLDIFNNLDESSEIGLCNMFAHKNIRLVYEAKVSRAVFDYANKNGLTKCDSLGNCSTLNAALTKTKGNLAQYGGICGFDSSIVSLPCGDAKVNGDAGEGAIEIKAAWRRLTDVETKSGRFYTRKVIYYTGQQFVNQQYNNAVFGLVALHIIHKTKSFPTFVFASWEQVDDFDDANNINAEDLRFENTGTNLPNIPVTRAHPIHSQIPPVNDAVHAAFKAKDPATVWQYYKLVGVQATPIDGPPASPASSDTYSYYYLANIVVETNQTLQNFFGAAPNGVTVPFKNVYLNGAPGSPFQMGGCQGCHGTQGQSIGGDMSRLIGAAPSNSTAPPESIDADEAASLRSFIERSAAVSRR
ncbi:hypothetical protein RZS28_03735 [Methylocapsa polymorpha]|uniref:Cytochrome c domain-containing protein n=1 Tax=Methylocapsa polymorpha TaxID=3080828 RepID=A0ABZ0HSX8_9HYPH|nr:hypothetical protein RZS28_03735 [Methylocapsa sp. RX1]